MHSKPSESIEHINLHIGGRQPKPGWKILDAVAGPGVDFVGDISNLDMFDDCGCEQVYCSHVLEHVAQSEVVATLQGIHRILIPGGRLYISVPDLDVLCHLMLSPRLEAAEKFQVMRMMYGGQVDPFDFHKTGLNVAFLGEYLGLAGFRSMDVVDSFNLFEDTSSFVFGGAAISLNVIVEKPQSVDSPLT